MNSLWDRIRQRKVVQWALAYLAGGWLILQVLDVLGQNLDWPAWVFRVTIALLSVGFLAALVLAWYHGEKGRQRVSGMEVLMLAGILVIAGAAVALVRSDADPRHDASALSDQQAPDASPPPGDPDGASAAIRSLAVLPLDNLAPEPEAEVWFADGMTEALIAELGKISALKVISRTSAMRYRETTKTLPEIARELNVDGLLEGSVLRAGERVRITVQLIHGATDHHLWSDSYERDLEDILALQGDVARAVAREIQVTVAPEEEARLAGQRVVDPEAHGEYLRGNLELGQPTQAAFQRAAVHFRRAIGIDSTYAPAHAGLAMAYIRLASWASSVAPGTVYTPARRAALRAVELDSTLAEGHVALGRIRHLFEWDWAGAEAAFRRGIALNPSSAPALSMYSNYLLSMGRFEQALRIGRRAVERDPLAPHAQIALGFALLWLGRDAEAMEPYEKALELSPDLAEPHITLAGVEARRGRLDDALRHAERADSLLGNSGAPLWMGRLGAVYVRLDRRTDALRILSELETRAEEEYVTPLALALIYLALDREETVLDLLEQLYEQRAVGAIWLKVWESPSLRAHPRFQALLQRMEFPQD